MFKIRIYDTDSNRWHDSGEGPWDTLTGAIEFGQSEVGMPWEIYGWNVDLPSSGSDREIEEDLVCHTGGNHIVHGEEIGGDDENAEVGYLYCCQNERVIGSYTYSPKHKHFHFAPAAADRLAIYE